MAPRLLHAGNPGPLTGTGNNTWLFDGAEPTLIDAGVGLPAHVGAIADALDGRPLARVLVTHGHPDHASGVPALRKTWPRVEACKWPLPGEHGWRALADGDRVRAGDEELEVVATPGHAADHVCFWNARSRDLFAGDMVLEGTTVMIPAGRGGNLRDYLASLERLASLGAARIFPGHGPIVERPAETIRAYLDHRRARETQVFAAMAAGAPDLDAIVSHIYPAISDELRPAARLTVQAHVEKLRDDGRVPEAFRD